MSVPATETEMPMIGIDLGTTMTVVACWHNGAYTVIPNDLGNRVTPSVVAFVGQQRLVGNHAKDQANRNSKCTIFDSKRLIGTKYKDAEVQRDILRFPFKVVEDKKSGCPKVQVKSKGKTMNFAPEQISAFVLAYVKKCAEQFLGGPISKAVITVPAYFNDGQRKATIDAAQIAGLECVRNINEPTAAALAYGVSEKETQQQINVIVYDWGGGTFDTTVLCFKDGTVDVRATGGDTHLGGSDIDERLLVYVLEIVRETFGVDLKDDQKAMSRLREACEKVKMHLSSNIEAECFVPNLIGDKDLVQLISRAEFESLIEDLAKLTIEKCNFALEEANMSKDEINKIILVGGSSRIPLVQRLLSHNFGGKLLTQSLHGDEVVAIGAVASSQLYAGSRFHLSVTEGPNSSPVLLLSAWRGASARVRADLQRQWQFATSDPHLPPALAEAFRESRNRYPSGESVVLDTGEHLSGADEQYRIAPPPYEGRSSTPQVPRDQSSDDGQNDSFIRWTLSKAARNRTVDVVDRTVNSWPFLTGCFNPDGELIVRRTHRAEQSEPLPTFLLEEIDVERSLLSVVIDDLTLQAQQVLPLFSGQHGNQPNGLLPHSPVFYDVRLDRAHFRLVDVIGHCNVKADLIWQRRQLLLQKRSAGPFYVEAGSELAEGVLTDRREGISDLLTEAARLAYGIGTLTSLQLKYECRDKPTQKKIVQEVAYSQSLADAADTLSRAANLLREIVIDPLVVKETDAGIVVLEFSAGEVGFSP